MIFVSTCPHSLLLEPHREDHGPLAAERCTHTKARHNEEGEAAEDGDPGTSEDIILAWDTHQWVHTVLVSCHPYCLSKQGQAWQLDRAAV